MVVPTLTLSTDGSDSTTNTPDPFHADPESHRHRRRPSIISRARDMISGSVANRTGLLDGPLRFFDGNMVDEPHEDILLEPTASPPHTPTPGSPSSPSANRGDRPPRPAPRTSYDFRRPTLSPENSPPPSNIYPRRTISRVFSMSSYVLAGHNIPEDERDAEALAHIWWTYANEANEFDHRRISQLNKSLDVRLIFSGIFSAILTPFIVESYKLLHKQPSPAFFGRDGFVVRVNTMWFGSLILSIIAGLFCIHCKMWLDGYGAVIGCAGAASESLHNGCRLRQYRYQGMQKYYISEMIGLLPVLLYAALAFFAIGLVDFLWQLNQAIAIYISVLCALVLIFHVGTTIIPCFTTRSPFRTPLSNLLGNLWRGMLQQCHPKGLMEDEERLDVDGLGSELDANSLKWLMEHTQSEDVYQEALRAERAFLRQQSQLPTPT